MLRWQTLLNRRCLVETPQSQSNCDAAIVILHAKGMLPSEMYDCVHVDRFARAGIAVVLPPSAQALEWQNVPSAERNDDVGFIDSLPAQIVETLGVSQVYAAGFSSGGFLLNLMSVVGLGRGYSHLWQVAATMFHAVYELPMSPDCASISIIAGMNDPIVPIDGRGVLSDKAIVSLDDAEATLRARGCELDTTIHAGGHAWPGGTCPHGLAQKLGGWPSTPDVTQMIIDQITAW